jgi:hypothetical protein
VQQRYDNYEPYFKKHDIAFLRLAEPGDSVTLA